MTNKTFHSSKTQKEKPSAMNVSKYLPAKNALLSPHTKTMENCKTRKKRFAKSSRYSTNVAVEKGSVKYAKCASPSSPKLASPAQPHMAKITHKNHSLQRSQFLPRRQSQLPPTLRHNQNPRTISNHFSIEHVRAKYIK